jgi:hypothetical protein
VTFTAEGAKPYPVVLELQHLERHGDQLLPQLDGIWSGWQTGGLDLFAAGPAASLNGQPGRPSTGTRAARPGSGRGS